MLRNPVKSGQRSAMPAEYGVACLLVPKHVSPRELVAVIDGR